MTRERRRFSEATISLREVGLHLKNLANVANTDCFCASATTSPVADPDIMPAPAWRMGCVIPRQRTKRIPYLAPLAKHERAKEHHGAVRAFISTYSATALGARKRGGPKVHTQLLGTRLPLHRWAEEISEATRSGVACRAAHPPVANAGPVRSEFGAAAPVHSRRPAGSLGTTRGIMCPARGPAHARPSSPAFKGHGRSLANPTFAAAPPCTPPLSPARRPG